MKSLLRSSIRALGPWGQQRKIALLSRHARLPLHFSLCRGAIKPGQCAIKPGQAQSTPILPPERSVGGRMGATPQGGGDLISRVKNLIASS